MARFSLLAWLLVAGVAAEASAQSPEMRAQFAYDEAIRRRDAGAFLECVAALEKARTSLGRPALRIQGPLVECNFKAGRWQETIHEAKAYFELNKDAKSQEYHDVGSMLIRAEEALKAADARAAAALVAKRDAWARAEQIVRSGAGLVYESEDWRGWPTTFSTSIQFVQPCVIEVAYEYSWEEPETSTPGEDYNFRDEEWTARFPLASTSLELRVDNLPETELNHGIFFYDASTRLYYQCRAAVMRECAKHCRKDDSWCDVQRDSLGFVVKHRSTRDALVNALIELQRQCRENPSLR